MGGRARPDFAKMKVKLNDKERDFYENLSELYSILVATEHLERHYLRGGMKPEELLAVSDLRYSQDCLQLLSHFKTFSCLNDSVDIKKYFQTYYRHA
jgi:ESCRT-I complex subunit VPS28